MERERDRERLCSVRPRVSQRDRGEGWRERERKAVFSETTGQSERQG